jgi:hypothetical protein
VLHVYLGGGHLLDLGAGQVSWTHLWKGFGALFGAYYFAALATADSSRGAPPRLGGKA